ncbi:penicillin-binding protein 1A [Zwartia panacis]|uniref:penicillin-binding protein 1A n=1 Tax=Zwartia panacis TaxID=2683345 RepID=UPI0025B48ACD|nr:PBP1A family penicillin-binding protein [Zwartia panacis]MDN4018321.1 PBP1A family penicillin-binding protein [Zwartia panacis]
MSKYNHPHDDEDQTTDKPKGSFLVRFLLKFTILTAGLALCATLLIGMALALAWPNLPDLNAMTDYRPRVPLRIYTSDKVLIGEFGEERRNVLRFDEIPDVMKSAVLSAEDDRFYQHGGIDWIGVVRAGLTNLISMQKSQGASTITMQVARNFYLSSEKTWSRKFYELLLTFKIEASLSKDQILELYLNQIYLGHRAYGFAAASRVYLGKELSEITAADAALLAGIPKAPSRFNPIANKPRAVLRQRYVLGRMHSLGYLTDAEYKAALAQPVVIKPSQGTPAGGYAVHGEYAAELARQLMISIYPDNVYTRGLNVYTTIHSKDQQWAYESLREGVLDYTRRAPYPGPEAQLTLPNGIEDDPAKLDEFLDGVFDKHPDRTDMLTGVVLSVKPTEVRVARSSTEIVVINDKRALGVIARALNPKAPAALRLQRGSVVYLHKAPTYWEILNLPTVQAAFVAMIPQDGALRAMVGGFDFYHGNFNRVTQAWRQPGSAFKPFIYAASLERGLTPGTMISDQPFELTAEQTGSGKAWTPKNYGGEYAEMLSMREAIARSKNMVSIRILQSIGPQYAQEYIARFGFDKAKHPAVLPMALGSGAVTPMQLAAGFSVFANGGYRVTPYLIDHVTDANGQVLMRAKPIVAGDSAARAIDARTAYVMDDMLRGVATSGTAARSRQVLKRGDLAGKTGTTNDSVDAWFAGYTPQLVGVAWLGYDQPKSLGSRETGGGASLPIWLGYMQHALKEFPEQKRGPVPEGLIVEGGNMYFKEFPPKEAVKSLGDPKQDSLGDLLETLGGSGSSNNRDSNRQPIGN